MVVPTATVTAGGLKANSTMLTSTVPPGAQVGVAAGTVTVLVEVGGIGVLVAAGVLTGVPVPHAGRVPVIMKPGEREAVLHENCVNALLFCCTPTVPLDPFSP